MSILPSARENRDRARNYPTLVQESSVIDQAIMDATTSGALVVEISNSFMTEPNTVQAQNYYKSWKSLTQDEILRDQMNTIIRNYTDRGYKITRKTNPQTMNTFIWVIRW